MRVLPDILATIGMASAAAMPMDQLSEWADLAKTFGIVGLILIYFMVRDNLRMKDDRREKAAMNERIDDLVKTIITDYREELKRSNQTITRASATHKLLIDTYAKHSPAMHDHQVATAKDDESTSEIRKQQ